MNPAYLFAGLCLAIAYFVYRRMPGDYDFAREREFRMRLPFPATGIPDLVIERRISLFSSFLIVVDLKTRMRQMVFESDVIQLSLYKLLLEKATGRKVAENGWVLVKNGAGEQYHQVKLYGEQKLIEIYQRRQAILAGQITPQPTKSRGLCHQCAYREECKQVVSQ